MKTNIEINGVCEEEYFLCSFGMNAQDYYSLVNFSPYPDYDNHCYKYNSDISDPCPFIGSSTGLNCLSATDTPGRIYTFFPSVQSTNYDPNN